MVTANLLAEDAPSHGTHGLSLEVDHHHKHHFGLFLGGATRFEEHHDNETGFTIGLDYEYKPLPKWGVGALVEGVAFGDNHRDLAFAFPVSFHPIEPLKLAAGPGFETSGSHTEFMVRVSAAYGFEIGKFTLSPEIAVDFVEGAQTLVFGFSIGRGF